MSNIKWVDPSHIDELVEESQKLGFYDPIYVEDLTPQLGSDLKIDISPEELLAMIENPNLETDIHYDCCVKDYIEDVIDREETKLTSKPPIAYNLIGKESEEGLARIWESGNIKYPGKRGQWTDQDYTITQIMDSLMRHIVNFANGEDLDDESGLPNVDHIQARAKMLSQTWHTKKELDDR